MARYEDTATPFAEAQFAGVRERKQQEAKKQEKFAKKLAVVQTVAKGANALINSRGDEFDANQVGQKASYTKFINDGQKLINTQDTITATGKSTEQYFHDFFYKQLTAQGDGKIPEYNKDTSYSDHLYSEAKKLADAHTVTFNKALTAAQAAPSLDEYIAKYDLYAKTRQPRSIFSTVTNFITGLGKKETPETLAFKNARDRNVIHGTPMAQKLKDLGLNLTALEGAGYNSMEILSGAEALAKKGGKVEENVTFEKYTEDNPDGTTTSGVRATGTYKGSGKPFIKEMGDPKTVRDDDKFVSQDARFALIDAMPTSMQEDFAKRLGPNLLKTDLINFEVEVVQNKISDVKTLTDAKAEVRKQFDATRDQRYKLVTQKMINNPLNKDLLTQDDLGKEMWTRDYLAKDLISYTDNPKYNTVLVNEGLDYDSYEKDLFKRMRVRYDDFEIPTGNGDDDANTAAVLEDTNVRRLQGAAPALVNVNPKDKAKVKDLIDDATSSDFSNSNILGRLIQDVMENSKNPNYINDQYNGNYKDGVFVIASDVNLGVYFNNAMQGTGSILYDPDKKEIYVTPGQPANPNPTKTATLTTTSDLISTADLDTLVSSSSTKMSGTRKSSVPVLYTPDVTKIINNVTLDILVQKGYLKSATKDLIESKPTIYAGALKDAKEKYKKDLRTVVKDKMEENKNMLASL